MSARALVAMLVLGGLGCARSCASRPAAPLAVPPREPAEERRALEATLKGAGLDPARLSVLRSEPRVVFALEVPGEDAVRTWEALRGLLGTTGRYPVILGFHSGDGELALRGEGALEARIARSLALEADPKAWARERKAQFADLLGDAGDWLERLRREEREHREQVLQAPWPTEPVEPMADFTLPYDLLTRKPLPKVQVALLPTAEGWQAPIHLDFGGFNECPLPEQHGAMLRKWGREYGAEVVGLSGDVLELRVLRPPKTRQAALTLALEQYEYCADIVDQGTGTLSALAAGLVDGRIWYFWWD